MQLPKSRNKYATKRAHTLLKQSRQANLPGRVERLSLIQPFKEVKGYDFLPMHKAVYNLSYIETLFEKIQCLMNANVFKMPDLSKIDSDTLMELEFEIDNRSEERIENDLFFNQSKLVSNVSFVAEDKEFIENCYVESIRPRDVYGSMTVRGLFKKPKSPDVLAIAIMEAFLGVCTWEQVEYHKAVDMTMENANESIHFDNEGKQILDANWRSNKEAFHLYHINKSISCYKILTLEKLWAEKHFVLNKMLTDMLFTIDIPKIEKWLKADTAEAAFLKGVLYLFGHSFKMSDFETKTDDEEITVSVSCTYCLLYDFDDYCTVIDEHNNSYREGGLSSICYEKFYFKDRIMDMNYTTDIKTLMQVFTFLFAYNTKNKTFDYEENFDIQAYFHALHLPQWQELLRRAISDRRKSHPNGMVSDERRVYP